MSDSPSKPAPNDRRPSLELYSQAPLPTRRGVFQTSVFRDPGDGAEHVAMVLGDVRGGAGVLTRVHSECLTGEVLGSLKCDCGEQLNRALDAIAAAGSGVLIYLRQEGRGIGLGNKLKAYALQAEGADTFEANRLLGLPDDLRRYDGAADILHTLGVASVDLITNNRLKIAGLEAAGIPVRRRIPATASQNPHNVDYLRIKRDRAGHLIDVDPVAGQEQDGKPKAS